MHMYGGKASSMHCNLKHKCTPELKLYLPPSQQILRHGLVGGEAGTDELQQILCICA